MTRPDAYAETEPRLVLCYVGDCDRRVYARGVCSMHYQRMMKRGDMRPRVVIKGCSVDGCDEAHYGRGWCRKHWTRWRATGDPLSTPESPFYADRPCPSCGSRATVPFDPRPEKAGRPPSSELGTCVSCGHVFSALARTSSAGRVGSPRPPTGGVRGGAGRLSPQARSSDRVPTPALGASTQTDTSPEPRTRGRRNVPAATGTDGA